MTNFLSKPYTAGEILAAIGGLLLFAWYRTVVSLPMARRPSFIIKACYKWGVPATSLLLFVVGVCVLLAIDVRLALAGAIVLPTLFFLFIKFDRYSATTRLLYHQYRTLRDEKPDMADLEVLFHIAQRRYPTWSQERILQFVAGKDVTELILLILVTEGQINPLLDWELYRSVKTKVSRITRPSEV